MSDDIDMGSDDICQECGHAHSPKPAPTLYVYNPPSWRPIEMAPDDGTKVLGYYRQNGNMVVVSKKYFWTDSLDCKPVNAPDAWFPLPEPPQ